MQRKETSITVPSKTVDRRPLAELNLLDDFLFGQVVSYPEIGERFVRILLRTIFGREFGRLSVTSQKALCGADTHLHGARLDVCLEPVEAGEPDGRATVYDIEPDLKTSGVDRRTLSRRTRFYHGKIAARSLNAGADYDTLKDVVVIMILPYDPFGFHRMVYTVKTKCVEVPEMEYDDGASTLFLYTRGTVDIPREELQQLLRYMERSVRENAVSGELREIHEMVETVKYDSEVGRVHIQMLEDIKKQAQEITELTRENTMKEKEIANLLSQIQQLKEEIAQMKAAGKPKAGD